MHYSYYHIALFIFIIGEEMLQGIDPQTHAKVHITPFDARQSCCVFRQFCRKRIQVEGAVFQGSRQETGPTALIVKEVN